MFENWSIFEVIKRTAKCVKFLGHPVRSLLKDYRVTQKVSHYQESSLNRTKNRHEGMIFHQF